MNEFYRALSHVNKLVYEPNHLSIKSIQEEYQNSEYGAGTFHLDAKSVRFRIAKITPKKVGQFVAIWEKDENDKNHPFAYENSPDLLVINTSMSNNHFGQFIFPKEILAKQNILKTQNAKGKMTIRIYPIWDHPTSKQAITTQKWQLPFFVDLSHANKLPIQKILELYSM